MTAHYALAAHIRLCRTPSDTVGLDLDRNRYFSVGPRECAVLARLGLMAHDQHEPTTLHDTQFVQLADSLVRAGLLAIDSTNTPTTTATTPSTSTPLPFPRASAGYEYAVSSPLRPHHALHLITAWRWAKTMLAHASLHSIARHVMNSRPPSNIDTTHLIALVTLFRTLRPFVYCARDRCLLHALTLVRFLAHYNEHPHWVIGVRTRPWGAHSWVQAGELVLDARPDDVCEYTPILVA